MDNFTRRVLLVEDNEDDYLIVRDLLSDISTTQFSLDWVDSSKAARESLEQNAYDVCLLDYRLDEATGVELVREFAGSNTPFILLTGNEDYQVDVEAAQSGVADYLLKGHINGPLVERSIRYAIERKKTEAALVQAQLFAQATVDALPENIAVLDGEGAIVAVNAAWRDFGHENGLACIASGVGTNYLAVCDRSDDADARTTAVGIRSVIAGKQSTFSLEYPCHSPNGPQWFRLCATRFAGQGPLHVAVSHENITERKQAEELLRKSEANLARAQQIAHLGSWELDLSNLENVDANALRWSDEVFRIFGVEPGQIEVSTDNFFRFVHPDDRQTVRLTMAQSVRERRTYSLDHRIVLPDGTWRIVHEESELVFDLDGQPIKMVGTVQDITGRKLAEEALEARTREIVTTWESMTDAFFSLDTNWCFTYINAQAAPYMNRSAEELIGKNIWDIYPVATDLKFYGEFHRAMRDQVPVDFEELYAPHGAWHEVHAYPSPVGLSVYFRDITERRVASDAIERLAAIVESSGDAIIGKTLEGVITSWNAGAQALYGYSPAEAIGQSVMGLIAAGHEEEEAQLLAKIARGENVANFETGRVCRDGRPVEISLTLSPVRDGKGQIVGASSISRDISDRKQAELALRASEERFQAIVTNVPGMVYQFVLAPDGSVAWPFVSEGCRDIFGVGPDMFQTHSFWPLEQIHPDDREEFGNSVAQSASSLLPWSWEGRHRFKSGKTKWVQAVARPRRLPNGSTLWDGVVMDTTARKEAEEERDRFFRLSLEMLAVVGTDGFFKRVNPAFCDTLGWSEEEILATPFLELGHPDEVAATQSVLEHLSQSDEVIGFENRYRTSEGSWKWLEWKSVAVPEEGLLYAAARDITGRKEYEAALLRMRDELEVRVEERTCQLEERTFQLEESNVSLQNEIATRARAEHEVRTQARQHEAIADLGRQALRNGDLDTLLRGAVELVNSTLDVEICSFWEGSPGSQTLRLRTVTSPGSTPPVDAPQFKTVGECSQIGQAALLNQVVITNDLRDDPHFSPSPFLLQQGIVSTISIPVHDGELYGVLCACSSLQRKFDKKEVFFLQTVANVLASAIARKQAEAEIHQLNNDLHHVNDSLRANEARLLRGNQISTDLINLRVKSQEDLEEAFHQITESACKMLNAERGSAWLFNEEGTHLRCLDVFDRATHSHSRGEDLPVDAAYFEFLKAQRLIVADDAHNHPALAVFKETLFKPHGIASTLHVALIVNGKLIGVLCSANKNKQRHWEAEDRTFASAIASVSSLLLESFERTRAEAALQEAKEEAERANRAKSEFLSRMSHELRTPLNAILGFGQVLEMRGGDPKQLGNVKQILKAGRHLLGLINEVLDIARIEAGHLSLSIEPIRLGNVIGETLDLVRPIAAGRQICLVDEIACDDAVLHAMADRQRFKQVLLNLLSNAVKYNREAGTVSISCSVVSPYFAGEAKVEEKFLRISVRDTGAGLSPQQIEKLFVPFQRLDAANSQIEGTGIGLTLCKRLIEAMNGTIGVHSEVGKGSTFWVELPLASSVLEAPLDVVDEIEHRVDVSGTILYVEDNLSNINLIEQVLADHDDKFNLLTAMQGSVGFELAIQHLPDLILLDVHLPDTTGDAVLSRLKAHPATQNIPVVVLSADATPSQVQRLLCLGAQGYLTKPLHLKQFFCMLEEVLSKAH